MKRILLGLICIFFSACSPQSDSFQIYTKNFESGQKQGELIIAEIPQNHYLASIQLDSSSPKSVFNWLEKCQNCLAINGAYFDQEFQNVGYLKVPNAETADMNFDEKLSGILTIQDGQIQVQDFSKTSLDQINQNPDIEAALQSYPILVKEDQNQIKSDSGKKARRTAIGQSSDKIYIFFTDNNLLSLYELAELIAAQKLGLETVINLDGGPSSGLAWKDQTEIFGYSSFSLVPNILLFQKQSSN